MVSPSAETNGNAGVPNQKKPDGVPAGKYTLVGWDMDTTGRRLIDEIYHIGAYTPTASFSQYIMPHGDLSFNVRRRHNIRVVTIGYYRMLKDITANKVLKTKSEISALTDFLDWLEAQKKEEPDSQGIILIIHEPRKVNAPMLLDSLHRYNLVARFKSLVVGIADSQALAADKCQDTVKSHSLRVLTNVFLTEGSTTGLENATDRAAAAYKVVQHLSQGEQQELSGKGDNNSVDKSTMCNLVREYTHSLDSELADLAELKSLLEKQNTFKPVFGPLLNTTKEERLKAASLRRLLAEAGMDYASLKTVWDTKKLTGLEEELSCLNVNAEENQVKELIEILDCHFDPEKESKVPKIPPPTRRPNYMRPRWSGNRGGRRQQYRRGGPTENNKSDNNTASNAEESGTTSPDTTSSGSPAKVKDELQNETSQVPTIVA